MSDSRKNVRMSKKQVLYRKKRQLEKRMILLLFIISYVILSFSIKKLNAQVKQIQTTIQRIENVRYEMSEIKSEETKDSDYPDYVSTIGEVEVLDRSNVLGQKLYRNDESCAGSGRDSDLCHAGRGFYGSGAFYYNLWV